MKKNGFVLIETIIVMSILAIGLISLYSSYVLIVRKLLSSSYEKPQDTYMAYELAKNIDYTINGYVTNSYYLEVANIDNTYKVRECGLNASNKGNCSNYEKLPNGGDIMLYKTLGVEKVYYTNRNAKELYNPNVLLTFDGTSISYLNSIINDDSFYENTTKTVIVKVKTDALGYEFSYYQE